MNDFESSVKLDASSRSSLAASLRALTPGQEGWISMSEAASLFSTKEPDYAFGETDDEGPEISRLLLGQRPDTVSTSCRRKIGYIFWMI